LLSDGPSSERARPGSHRMCRTRWRQRPLSTPRPRLPSMERTSGARADAERACERHLRAHPERARGARWVLVLRDCGAGISRYARERRKPRPRTSGGHRRTRFSRSRSKRSSSFANTEACWRTSASSSGSELIRACQSIRDAAPASVSPTGPHRMSPSWRPRSRAAQGGGGFPRSLSPPMDHLPGEGTGWAASSCSLATRHRLHATRIYRDNRPGSASLGHRFTRPRSRRASVAVPPGRC
jgi:hypothetical protein